MIGAEICFAIRKEDRKTLIGNKTKRRDCETGRSAYGVVRDQQLVEPDRQCIWIVDFNVIIRVMDIPPCKPLVDA